MSPKHLARTATLLNIYSSTWTEPVELGVQMRLGVSRRGAHQLARLCALILVVADVINAIVWIGKVIEKLHGFRLDCLEALRAFKIARQNFSSTSRSPSASRLRGLALAAARGG